MREKVTFADGIKEGLPICIAYVAVSFTFGLVVVGYGAPAWLATLISATNLTSAGQFAGVSLMAQSAAYIEIIIAVLVINLRYALMSMSMSQQLDDETGTGKRLLMSAFITDETFAVATTKKRDLNFAYFMGLTLTPYFGWSLGTLAGALVGAILPDRLCAAMGIALYCMFIAIIIPPCKKSRAIIFCILLSVALTCLMYYLPFLAFITAGFRVVIAACVAAGVTAFVCPVKDDEATRDRDTEAAR